MGEINMKKKKTELLIQNLSLKIILNLLKKDFETAKINWSQLIPLINKLKKNEYRKL